MKKLSLLMIICLLFFTGCSYFDIILEQNEKDVENKNKENSDQEKAPYALPDTIIPDSIDFPLFNELGYVLSPMTPDGDGVYREEFADKASIGFGYTLSRYSAPYIMNGVEQTTEIVAFFTYNFSVHNIYNEKDNLSIEIKINDIYNNALKEKESLDTKYNAQDKNSGDYLSVSYKTDTTVQTELSKAAGDFAELGGIHDISYVTTNSPYTVVIKMYGMPSPEYDQIKDVLIQYSQELGAISKEAIESSYEAYLNE